MSRPVMREQAREKMRAWRAENAERVRSALPDDTDAPPGVVRNSQRKAITGTDWPGCRRCDHVYMHADDCPWYDGGEGE